MSETATPTAASWPKYALPKDTTINGYRIERVLGSGGFGVTYLARDLLGQLFAIKEYFPRQFAIREDLTVVAASAEDTPLFEECRDRFLREAQALVLLGRRARAEAAVRGERLAAALSLGPYRPSAPPAAADLGAQRRRDLLDAVEEHGGFSPEARAAAAEITRHRTR